MDEILIGEKKYVSSKQAAKLTGYAKDYVGQLCREGRVPARLVGRSWYVLESAIHDHRFNEQSEEKESQPENAALASTWEAPHYEAIPADVLPVQNPEELLEKEAEDDGKIMNFATPQNLQDSWKAWFDRIENPKAAAPSAPSKVEEREIESREVSVPVHAIHHPEYKPLPEELSPRRTRLAATQPVREEEYEQEMPRREERRTGRRLGAAFQLVGALVALVMASLAVVGSGYFDEYIISTNQAGMFAGVGLYNR
ncbi:MAG: helix-turn-helix domain-containing protein [Candidatus Paceibacterota bacterium]|jgi:hypothetical protein